MNIGLGYRPFGNGWLVNRVGSLVMSTFAKFYQFHKPMVNALHDGIHLGCVISRYHVITLWIAQPRPSLISWSIERDTKSRCQIFLGLVHSASIKASPSLCEVTHLHHDNLRSILRPPATPVGLKLPKFHILLVEYPHALPLPRPHRC